MDKYVRVKEIGEGSFGKALLVRSKANGKQMVIKEINMKKMSRKEREEARKEVAVLAQLHHPNIVSYRESFEEIGNLYIAMDYCDGGDLYGRINKQRGLLFTEDQVLDWFVQTCLAIKHIHDRKILHRDIKSQNIFLTKHGIVKLGDFGIAKVLNSTVELARTCIGTPYYLSPEICENKPYNNKSDIWSLGCVLYELATLKHAFEAGNMKNLVLKIIRGSYPPPPPRYTYELRNLIALLFKRSPRDRPSINTVLRKPLLQSRIRKFLSENEVADEFSHTVMHGVKIKKQVPTGDARPLPPKPNLVNKAPTPVPKYNPASVYAPSVARKGPSNRKSSDVRKSGGDVRKPAMSPSPASHMNDLARRRQELIDKERKRRDEAKKKILEQQHQQQQAYAKRHQELVDKQKQARINKAREEGWKGMMDSISSEDSDKRSTSKSVNSEKSKTLEKNRVRKKGPSVVKAATPKPTPSPAKERGNYDNYHNYLDKLNADRQAKNAAAVKPSPSPHVAHLGVAGALGGGPVHAARQGAAAGARGAEAANRARVVGDFMQRKQAAANNRARAHGDLYGGAAAAVSPRMSPSVANTPTPTPSAGRPESARDAREPAKHVPRAGEKNEQDYLARLRQIRLQNFNERRNIKDKVAGRADPKYKPPIDPRNDPDARRKKIEALKAQADERAKKLRDELEKKRKEAYELEQKRLKDQGKAKVQDRVSRAPSAAAKPAAPIPMTEAMKAIGVVQEGPPQAPSELEKCPIGMTAAMEAIGAGAPQPEADTTKLDRQKQKEAILKRLNAKPPVPEKSDRPKWGPPSKPAVSERLRWGAGDQASALRAKSLEETGSQMEATNAGDGVVKHLPFNPGQSPESPESSPDDSQPSARRQWGGPAGTVLNLLEHADISETSTIKSDSSDGSTVQLPQSSGRAGETASGGQAPAIGTTITIAKAPGKGTVVIKTPAASQPEQSKSDVTAPDIDLKVKDKRSRSPSPNVTTSENENMEQPEDKQSVSDKEGEKAPLFDRVELDEDEAKILVGQSLVVEDLDLHNEEGVDATNQKEEVTEDSKRSDETSSQEDKPAKDTTLSSSLKARSMKDPALVMGLTTGHFDTDVQMLRTCSEPDLSKLFRTIQQEDPVCAAEISLNISNLQEALLEAESTECEDDPQADNDDINVDEDGDTAEDDEASELTEATRGLETYVPDFGDIDDDDTEEGKEDEQPQEEEADEDDEEEDEEEEEEVTRADTDDEDIKTMRESMMSLLQTEDTTEDEPLHTSPKKKVKKSTKKGKKVKKKKVKDGLDQSAPRSRRWADSSMEDLQSMKETMKTLLKPESAKSPKHSTLKSIKEVDGTGDANSKQAVPMILPECESWQSDNSEEDDDYFEEEDMFSRLEASRAKLEQELGCDTFLKAYKTVQAIHEDEDENMEEGVHLVSSILGHDNIHLYPSILQLVMADGVFTEDND